MVFTSTVHCQATPGLSKTWACLQMYKQHRSKGHNELWCFQVSWIYFSFSWCCATTLTCSWTKRMAALSCISNIPPWEFHHIFPQQQRKQVKDVISHTLTHACTHCWLRSSFNWKEVITRGEIAVSSNQRERNQLSKSWKHVQPQPIVSDTLTKGD